MKFAVYVCLASLACTFLNISFLVTRELLVTNDIKYSHITLEAPNSYYGLENAVMDPTAAPPSPIVNPPFFAGHINKSNPYTVYREDNRHFMDFGTVYPTDRKFIVEPRVSTIAQFRVQDFGMERCTLRLSTGTSNTRDIGTELTGRIELWKLHQKGRLDPNLLSWKTRPQRSLMLASWDASSANRMETETFLCASNSILTFELACAQEQNCRLQFNQPREKPHSGGFKI
ncbi:hypothetical protein C8J56DRAFT_784707 [Mycena floridula]|nr:hypothetical protein C8J56DRAFT_784707 [Mycena floridula]